MDNLKIKKMNTYTQTLYQIIFGTYNNSKVLSPDNSPILYKYMAQIIKNKKCHLYIINGVEDHIHILTDLHPTIALANLVKDIKVASSGFIKENNLFPGFQGWRKGYGAFTYSIKEKEALINYIKNQQEHHKKKRSRRR